MFIIMVSTEMNFVMVTMELEKNFNILYEAVDITPPDVTSKVKIVVMVSPGKESALGTPGSQLTMSFLRLFILGGHGLEIVHGYTY